MNLIEQLEALQVCFVELSANKTEKLVLYDDLRAIIEQAKREAVEPIAVPAGYKLVPIEPTDDMKRAYTDKYGFPSYGAGHEYRFMVKEAPESTQQDHTKLIEQLLAVIAKKDEALIKACELIEKFSLQVYNGSDCLRVYDALALQPSDVELVEVGRWVDEGNSDESDFYPVSYCGREGSGDMCYTIKTKADTK